MSVIDMRPPRRTVNLGLPVPGDAEAADNPQVIGDLADAIDALEGAGRFGWETGDIKASGRQVAPTGWLLCNGQWVARSVYSELFDAIGTRYGPGDGTADSFSLPDLRDCFLLGVSGTRPSGMRGGLETVTLSAAQMPSHAHGGTTGTDAPDHQHYVNPVTTDVDWQDHNHAYGAHGANSEYVVIWTSGAQGRWWQTMGLGWTGGWNTGGRQQHHNHTVPAQWSGGASARHTHGIPVQGGDQPHSNMPPFVAVSYLIKT